MVSGVGGGNIDVAAIVDSLMAVERRPLQSMQAEVRSINSRISALGTVQSQLSSLRDAARKLASADGLMLSTFTSSDDKVATARSAGNATPGTYSLTVSRLASAQSIASAPVTDASSVVGSGSLQIEIGAMNGGLFTPNGTGTTVTIAPANNTLAGIRDAINASGAGVSASIVRDAGGARLVLSSKQSGEANLIRVTATDDGASPAPGLGALAYNPAAPTATATREVQPGVDALFRLNGMDLRSASNTVTGVVDGLEISLKNTTASPVSLQVATDSDGLKKMLGEFVTAYNAINSSLVAQTKYDPSNKSAGPLQGQRVAVNALNQLRAMVRNPAADDVGGLSSGGLFNIARDGTLSINQTEVDKALANPARFRELMSRDGTAGNFSSQGIGDRFVNLVDGLIGSDGSVSTQITAWRQNITDNQRRQDRFNDRLQLTEQRLRQQYGSLDSQLSNIQAAMSPLASLINSMNR
jgi:flagellar hook-associated protein 2